MHFQIRFAESAVVPEGLGLADNDVRDKIIAAVVYWRAGGNAGQGAAV